MSTTLKQTVTQPSSGNLIAAASLNALANNALVLGSAYNNNQAGAGAGFVRCLITLNYKFQTAPGANTGLSLWLLRASDPTTDGSYEDGSSTLTPARIPDCVFPVGSSTDTNAHQIAREVRLPAGYFKPLLKNDGAGQSLTANNTDNFLTLAPITDQQV